MYSIILIKHFNSYQGGRGLCSQLIPKKNVFYTKMHKISTQKQRMQVYSEEEGGAGGEGIIL